MQHQRQVVHQTLAPKATGQEAASSTAAAPPELDGPALCAAFHNGNLDKLAAALATHPDAAFTFIHSGPADFSWDDLLALLSKKRDGLTTNQRQQLALFQRGIHRPDATPQLFKAVYGIDLDDKGASQRISSTESGIAFAQLASLPVGHAVAGEHYDRMETGAGNSSSFFGDTIKMGRYERTREVFGARSEEFTKRGIRSPVQLYAKTVRHEIGHAIDERLNADRSLAKRCGWTLYEHDAMDDWLSKIDAWTGADARPDFQECARTMLHEVFGQKLPGISTAFDGRIQALEATHTGFSAWLASTALGKAIEGSRNPTDFASRATVGGAMTWLSTNQQTAYVIDGTASAQIKSWGNGAASVTDKEWVAELYAEWYATPESPGSSKLAKGFPSEVQKFMRGPVAAYDG